MEIKSKHIKDLPDLEGKISLYEVKKVVKKLALGKAAGIDEIVNEILKYGGPKMITILWHLSNIWFSFLLVSQ